MTKSVASDRRPSAEYLKLAAAPIVRQTEPDLKLVILDLNGTLVFRKGGRGTAQVPLLRPGLAPFTRYLFHHFAVMVWSSSTTASVQTMCNAIFTPVQRTALVACWARDTLRLSREEYVRKVQTYKNLEWVWESKELRHVKRFSQRDTIIVDDSVLKLASHPFNLIQVPEFTRDVMQGGRDNALQEVMLHLEQLRTCDNVSAYLSQTAIRFGLVPRKIKKAKKAKQNKPEILQDVSFSTRQVVEETSDSDGSTSSSDTDVVEETPVSVP